MNFSPKNFENTADRFFELLNLHLNDPAVNDEVLSLCTQLKNYWSAALQSVVSCGTPHWQSVTSLLCCISTIQKFFSVILSRTTALTAACLFIIPVKSILTSMRALSSSGEKLLRYSAQNTIALIFVHLGKSIHSEIYRECLTDFFTLFDYGSIFSEKHKHLVICKLELLTILLKQLRRSNAELCCDFLEQFLPKLLNGRLLKSEHFQESNVFHLLLKFFKEVLTALPHQHDLAPSATEYIISLILTRHICSLNIHHRLVYLEVISASLKFYQNVDQEESAKIAKLFLQTLTDELMTLFSKNLDFVGFGGRQISENDAQCGFSSAEKMVLLNSTLRAYQLLLKKQDYSDIVCKADADIKILLGSSSTENLVNKLFEIYLEQDDSLIEFLLLHLTNHALMERLGKKFLISPHHLFVALLQHLSFDASVLLDWLTSNETQFLLYFLRYLKYLANTFVEFSSVCDSVFQPTTRDSVRSALKNLRQSIEKLCSKDLFPYPVTPLLNVMQRVENHFSHPQD